MVFSVILMLFGEYSFMPSVEDTIIIEEWLYLGPFSVGVGEEIIGIDEAIDLNKDFEPTEKFFYSSILTQGSNVTWRKVSAENSKVEIEYKNVLWDTIQDYYGVAGIRSAGYAYGDFYNNGQRRALVIAKGVSSFNLNGKTHPGDRYKYGYLETPVILKSGKNRVLLRLSGFGDHSFSFIIIPSPAPLIVIAGDITRPDLIVGKEDSVWIGIPLINTTNQRLHNIQLTIAGENIRTSIHSVPDIMPLSALKIPISIKPATIVTSEDDSLLLTITVMFGDLKTTQDIWLRVKHQDEAHVKTFISNIDSSCQYYAVLPPKGYVQENCYALIMTCHGAGVKAENQVKAYTQKNWAFVVAPTNRRRFGFNWQDWGRLDFLEVLEDVKMQFYIDTNRVYLTGHSMGGHGAWHIGTSHPDLFAAMAPSAGWTSIYLYIPAFLQKSYTFAHPEQIRYRDMVLRQDNPLLYLENLYNLPTHILQGGADDNVPPIQARMYAKYLSTLGYKHTYREVEGQKHWWDIDSTPGVDCVDSEEAMNFLRNEVRNPFPRKVVFKSSDIDHASSAYWIRIDALEDLYREGRIIAVVCDTTDFAEKSSSIQKIVVDVSNVSKFTLFLSEDLIAPGLVRFVINNQAFKFEYKDRCAVTFEKKDHESFFWCTESKGKGKVQGHYGPIKRAYFRPFVLVYGTIGDSLSTENNLHQARLQSYAWWYRANGFAEILPDTEITEEIIGKYNLILFGNAETNSVLKWINHKLPIRVEEKQVVMQTQRTKEQNLCLIEIYPNPLYPDNFVLLYSATSQEAQNIMGLFSPLYAGSGLPDYVVYDKSVLTYGWAGVVAAGFFDENWRLSNRLSFHQD